MTFGEGQFFGGRAAFVDFTVSMPVRMGGGPAWFTKMDRNGDGDVSRGEFLGSKDDFDKLDANKDGLIGLDEAQAFEQKARPKK